MGQVLHGSATTTEAVRRAIQHSQESLRRLAKRYGVNPKTIAKWKARSSVSRPADRTQAAQIDSPVSRGRGGRRRLPKAYCVAARRLPLRPRQPTIPHLTRSSLHRCLQRHGISRLPQVEGEASAKRKFKAYPIGYFHVDIAEVRTAQGKLYLIVAIDRTSKFAFVEMHEQLSPHRRRLPAPPDRRRPLQGPHGPHRQRNPLHHPRQHQLSRAGHQGGP